jgi:hypothetical protein
MAPGFGRDIVSSSTCPKNNEREALYDMKKKVSPGRVAAYCIQNG